MRPGRNSGGRVSRAGAAALAVLLIGAPSAAAITPPEIDPQEPPPAGTAGPAAPMAQRGACVATAVLPGTDPAAVSPNLTALNLSDAWRYSRGEGQLVAVIDTGVQPGPRLPDVEPGGDYVQNGDGLTDCDGHGTAVAGLIAGQPGPDGFSGVAPAARLLAIRQTSNHFAPTDAGADPVVTRAGLDVLNMARAVVRAADLGARVITISTATCLPADNTVAQSQLGAALRYAAVERDAVIVAAAGDVRSGGPTGTACRSNPLGDLSRPDDPRDWAGVGSVSIPSWWQPYVLSVGSLNTAGQPSDFTMSGPWVGVAAPGEDIASVSNAPGGGLANALPRGQDQQLAPLAGTGYAAGYVAGVAALVRSRYPELTAAQVVHRITATAQGAARSPSNLIGAGRVDPVAALTWDVPTEPETTGPAAKPVAAPPEPEAADNTPKIVAFAGVGVTALLLVVAAAVAAHRRKDSQT